MCIWTTRPAQLCESDMHLCDPILLCLMQRRLSTSTLNVPLHGICIQCCPVVGLSQVRTSTYPKAAIAQAGALRRRAFPRLRAPQCT